MNIEQLRDYCIAKKGVTEEFPFGPETLVFKVMNKMFALVGLDDAELKVNLKCDPAYAEELRDKYEEVQPGYHMNKKMWNTVHFEGNLSEKILLKLIDHSYEEVTKGLTKKDREMLERL